MQSGSQKSVLSLIINVEIQLISNAIFLISLSFLQFQEHIVGLTKSYEELQQENAENKRKLKAIAKVLNGTLG